MNPMTPNPGKPINDAADKLDKINDTIAQMKAGTGEGHRQIYAVARTKPSWFLSTWLDRLKGRRTTKMSRSFGFSNFDNFTVS